MRRRSTDKDEASDPGAMAPIGLERDLNTHGVTDQDCPIDLDII
jgi:hypothetical protein